MPDLTDGAQVPGAAPEPAQPRQAAAAAGVNLGEIERIVAGTHHDPHSILGVHPGPDGFAIRTLRPFAATVAALLEDGRRFPMEHVHPGMFATVVPYDEVPGPFPAYRIAVAYPGPDGVSGPVTVTDDPYRHLPTLGEFDLHLIGEGRHEELWRVLGAHVRDLGEDGLGPITGTSFAVWAPNARGVRVIGDFNHWNGQGHPMRSLGGSGIWELVRARGRRGVPLQVRDLRGGRHVAGQGRPDGGGHRAAARDRFRRGVVAPRVAGRRLDDGPAATAGRP